jgi:hypothetical protein
VNLLSGDWFFPSTTPSFQYSIFHPFHLVS